MQEIMVLTILLHPYFPLVSAFFGQFCALGFLDPFFIDFIDFLFFTETSKDLLQELTDLILDELQIGG